MNFKKNISICLLTILFSGNVFNANAVAEASVSLPSTIYMTIRGRRPVKLSYSVSKKAIRYLNNFLFFGQPWQSIPEKIRNCIIYSVGFHDELIDFHIMELKRIGASEEQSDISRMSSQFFCSGQSLLIAKKILENIQV